MAKILAIDDDVRILRIIKSALMLNNHQVFTIENASSANLEKINDYDLILLDVMMPVINGFEFCKVIRDLVDCPILFLTAKTDENSLVEGLICGGDDYISKPFSIKELIARVEAHLRRDVRKTSINRLVLNDIVFNFDRKEILVKNIALQLTKNEYKICEYLVLNRNRTVTKEMIYDAVYDIESNALFTTITEYIRSIRKKFKLFDVEPIETVWGIGYRWL